MRQERHRDSARRHLIHVPIIHTEADMGRLRDSVRRATIQRIGRRGWKRNLHRIDHVWTQIEEAIDGLDLPYDTVRLYQDGLPICDKELEIVDDLARAASRNHQLLRRLKDRGATIMGTESPELLLKEYQLIKQRMEAKNTREAAKVEARQKQLSASLLKERDRFVASRINDTLRPGEIGILFLGMLHSLNGLLDEDIEVQHVVNQPAQ